MSNRWSHDIDQLRGRLDGLIARADLTDGTSGLISETLEELAVVVEEMQSQNSELVASRTELEHERERYRKLFDTVPDGYLVTNSDGIIREVNATAASLFGQARHSIVGKPLALQVARDDRRAFYRLLNQVKDSAHNDRLSINLHVVNGPVVPVNLRATTNTDPETATEPSIRWLIHDRRPDIARHEIRSSEERLRALFEGAEIGIVLTDLDGTVVFANRRADGLLRRGENLLTLDDWLGCVHPEDDDEIRSVLGVVTETGESATIRHRVISSNGEVVWVDHGVASIRALHGSVDGLVSTLTDVTAEHLATTELRHTVQFTEAVLDTVGALVMVLAPDGTIELFNTACEAASGFDSATMISQDLFETLIPAERRAEARAAFARLVRGERFSYEAEWLTAAGARRTIMWSGTAIHTRRGAVRAIIGTGIDVTETRLLEARLIQADRLESVGRLAAGLAHDFNNTLSTLQLRIDRLGRRRQHAPDSFDQGELADDRADLDAAATSIEHTRHLISDVLSFSHQHVLDADRVSLNAEVERVMAMLTDHLGPQIRVELDLTSDDTTAMVDPGRFEQALTNIVLNAGDAMPAGGSITITSHSERVDAQGRRDVDDGDVPPLDPGDYVRMSIADTGTGMDPEIASHIFDPYFTTKPPSRGTGLGLATTYGTITHSSGAIKVNSTSGVGSEFIIWLPKADSCDLDPASPGASHSDQGRPATEQPSLGRILIVEDDPDVRDLVIDEVELLGYETLSADSAEAALVHPQLSDSIDDIDLLLSDVQLPGLDGAELSRRLATRSPDLATLFISGAGEHTLERILPPGVALLRKPFTVAELAAAIQAALSTQQGGA